ncbi:MAG: hypothetical protein E6J91_41685 [Deltaproteobacteria bacterium]|nr:MAG: hypothetical protein E6J91_41685 [Deltaproteobacteria bacterium]
MNVLVLSHADVVRLLPMDACIDVMAEALRTTSRGGAVLPLRSVVWMPDRTGMIGLMPGFLDAPTSLGLKVVSIFPGNHCSTPATAAPGPSSTPAASPRSAPPPSAASPPAPSPAATPATSPSSAPVSRPRPTSPPCAPCAPSGASASGAAPPPTPSASPTPAPSPSRSWPPRRPPSPAPT